MTRLILSPDLLFHQMEDNYVNFTIWFRTDDVKLWPSGFWTNEYLSAALDQKLWFSLGTKHTDGMFPFNGTKTRANSRNYFFSIPVHAISMSLFMFVSQSTYINDPRPCPFTCPCPCTCPYPCPRQVFMSLSMYCARPWLVRAHPHPCLYPCPCSF
jgi:hypothetical protein